MAQDDLKEQVRLLEGNYKIKQDLTPHHLKLIVRGLDMLDATLKQYDNGDNQQISYDRFDILTLKGLLRGNVSTELSRDQFMSFGAIAHVDYPNISND